MIEEQLNNLADAIKKELKLSDSKETLYFDNGDYFWPCDDKGNPISAKKFADQLGRKIRLYVKASSDKEIVIYRAAPRILYVINDAFITLGFIVGFGGIPVVFLVNAFHAILLIRTICLASFITLALKIVIAMKKRGRLIGFNGFQ